MDDAHIRLVRTTFFHACAPGPLGDRFAQRFYARLFERSPDVRDMFPADLVDQQRKLVDELAMIVGALDDLPAFVDRASELGRRHVQYGVVPEHYDVMLDVLLESLAEVLGGTFGRDAATAWRRAFHLVAETMLYGATHGPPEPAPR